MDKEFKTSEILDAVDSILKLKKKNTKNIIFNNKNDIPTDTEKIISQAEKFIIKN